METIRRASVLLLLAAGFLAGACFSTQDRPRRSQCLGQGKITIVDGRRQIGELACAGTCDDGSRCSVQQNAAGTRQWCGCPQEGEPEECHLARLKLPGGDWAFDCEGPCPQPQDLCTPVSRKVGDDTIFVSCECLTPQYPSGGGAPH